MTEIKLKEIGYPDEWTGYIRRSINKDHFAVFLALAKEAKEWPFPPIKIMRIDPKTKDKALAGIVKKGMAYLCLDGVHRLQVANAIGAKSIQAETLPQMDERTFYLEQFALNMGHGLRFDRNQRNSAINVLRDRFSYKMKEIGTRVGVSESSVSRILSGKQATGRLRKPGPKKQGCISPTATPIDVQPGLPVKPIGPPVFSVQEWFERVTSCVGDFRKHADSILRAKPFSLAFFDEAAAMFIRLRHTVKDLGEGQGNAEKTGPS